MRRASDSGQPFRLVLLDVMMPGMDGFDTLKRMHETPHFDNATVIMLSSAGRSEDKRRAAELGVARCLTKPVTQSQLFNAISQSLGTAVSEVAAVRFDARPTRAILYRGGFCWPRMAW